MPFHLFQFPLPCHGDLDELNRFLAGHRVVSVRERIVESSGAALLVFVVETVGQPEPRAGRGRVDYRDELDADDFELFRKLRDVRKTLSEAEGVPLFAVFSNAQLADMARRRCTSRAELAAIEGVGDARIDRYGEALLKVLQRHAKEPGDAG